MYFCRVRYVLWPVSQARGRVRLGPTLIADTHFFVGTEQTSLELPLMKLMFDGGARYLIADTHFFVGTEQTLLELPLMKLMFDGGARDRYG